MFISRTFSVKISGMELNWRPVML